MQNIVVDYIEFGNKRYYFGYNKPADIAAILQFNDSLKALIRENKLTDDLSKKYGLIPYSKESDFVTKIENFSYCLLCICSVGFLIMTAALLFIPLSSGLIPILLPLAAVAFCGNLITSTINIVIQGFFSIKERRAQKAAIVAAEGRSEDLFEKLAREDDHLAHKYQRLELEHKFEDEFSLIEKEEVSRTAINLMRSFEKNSLLKNATPASTGSPVPTP